MKDGGPVFPSHVTCGPIYKGISLRDYLIVHAPPEEIKDIAPNTIGGCADFLGIALSEYIGSRHYVLVLAKARGIWADAMLKERERAR